MTDLSVRIQPATHDDSINSQIGSPFIPGVPLEANQPIFGREEAIRFIVVESMRFKSVNLVGERRIGKTSLLNHLLGNQSKYFQHSKMQLPLILVRLDMQENISNAEQFYGKALRGLFEALPSQSYLSNQSLQAWLERLQAQPEATAIEFENELKRLKDVGLRPVLLIDEFERVFEQHLAAGFPFPDFFDGLRAQISASRLAMVLFTREKLVKYFTRHSLTSTFPSYFQPLTIKELDKEAADDLLLRQPSDRPLTTEQARHARSWSGCHPCRLQCAGAAWYQANSGGKSAQWAKERYTEIVEPLGLINPSYLPMTSVKGLSYRLRQTRFWFPLSTLMGLGILTWFGKIHWINATFTWCENNPVITVIFVVVGLIIVGKLNPEQAVKALLDKFQGDAKEGKK
jgi:hypothetical protein